MSVTLTGLLPAHTVEHMSESGAESTVWRIALKDEIRAFMATNPEPLWAPDEATRDWHFEHTIKRRVDDYEAVEVPGPIMEAIPREVERFKRVRAELHAKRRAERARQRGEA